MGTPTNFPYGLTSYGNPVVPVGVFKITVTSSDIKTATAKTIATASGEVAILNIIVKTDATGLAGGTNFQIKSNNASGLANILAEAISNLGANKTVDLFTASVTKQRTTIEDTKLLQVQNTAADGTGAGKVDIIVIYQPVTAGAYLS